MQPYGGARTGAGQRSVVLAFSKQSMTDDDHDDDDQESIGRRAKKYVSVGTKRISLEQLRKVLGLESVKELKIQMEISSKKRLYLFGRTCVRGRWILQSRVAGTIKTSAGNNGDFCD
jgi:hypothetical protein